MLLSQPFPPAVSYDPFPPPQVLQAHFASTSSREFSKSVYSKFAQVAPGPKNTRQAFMRFLCEVHQHAPALLPV